MLLKSVTVVVFWNGKVLLVKSGVSSDWPDGIYGLPAGKVEAEETWDEAAIWECFEESGITIKKMIMLPTFYEADIPRKGGSVKKFCAWSFLALEFEGELKSSEESTPMWVKISDIKNLPLVVNVDKMIEEALEFSQKSDGSVCPNQAQRQ